jgi:hypothetical protein
MSCYNGLSPANDQFSEHEWYCFITSEGNDKPPAATSTPLIYMHSPGNTVKREIIMTGNDIHSVIILHVTLVIFKFKTKDKY